MPAHYVYAAHIQAPITVCSNAWLLPGEQGEGGYDTGINFTNVLDLVGKFRERRIYRNEVNRLVLVAHGLSGAFWINRQYVGINADADVENLPSGRSPYFTTDYGWTLRNLTQPAIQNELHLVGHYLNNRSEVVLLGCNAGSGRNGDSFLIGLSLIWPGVRVVAFEVIIAHLGGQTSRGSGTNNCVAPGMVVTAATGSLGARRIGDPEPQGYRLNATTNRSHPWANASHPLAKIAQNGTIIHAPSAT